MTLDLTINGSNAGDTTTLVACDSAVWNAITYDSSGVYVDTLQTVNGCDSVEVLNLTINNSSSSTDVITACDSYTWIDGNTYTSSNNTATHTLINSNGCDSVVTLDLTINNSSSSVDGQVHCNSYTWIDGIVYTSSNNTATYMYQTADDCDSLVGFPCMIWLINLFYYYRSILLINEDTCATISSSSVYLLRSASASALDFLLLSPAALCWLYIC